MSKFIQQDNQKLLWNVSQKLPNIQKIFPETRQHELWFRNIIQHFYEQHKTESISKHRLTALNKQTIQHMIDSLKPYNDNNNSILKTGSRKVSFKAIRSDNLEGFNTQSALASVNFSSSNSNFTELNNQFRDGTMRSRVPDQLSEAERMTVHITPRPNAPLTEQRGIPTNILEERQLEYDSMLKREIPAEPVFRELMEDKAIDNMEELIQQQLRLRELDVAFFPKVPTDSNTVDATDKISQPPPSTNNSGLRPPLLGGFHPKAKLSPENTPKHSGLQINDILDSSVLFVNEELPDITIDPNPTPNVFVSEAKENNMIKMLSEIKEEIRELKKFLNYRPPPELSW